jgi:hypothetical protein
MLSGLVMFAFITITLFNHALRVVSLALAKVGCASKWSSGGALRLRFFYGAAAIHFH